MKELIPMPTETDVNRDVDEAYERREQEQYSVSVILDNIKKEKA